ncbi:hypothetical protein, partial [Priestia megaterium]|uniref:hypothetical protein n=1 Tax=Priestia megaterium TaxID=1404 RepID=UPI000C01E969
KGVSHLLNEEEKEKQKHENDNYEMLTEVEIKIETGFNWGADQRHWRKVSTASICETLGLSPKSKNVSQTLRKKGCEPHRKPTRGWTVPPFIKDRYSHY